jgi:transcriptional regulator with XRE-family HTH domain
MITLPMNPVIFRTLRRRLKLERAELADAMSLHDKNLQRYENAKAPIPDWHAKLLIMFSLYGVPPSFRSPPE